MKCTCAFSRDPTLGLMQYLEHLESFDIKTGAKKMNLIVLILYTNIVLMNDMLNVFTFTDVNRNCPIVIMLSIDCPEEEVCCKSDNKM